jgi:hypothetical protein
MRNRLRLDIFNMCELIWNFFPIFEKVINKFSLSRRNKNIDLGFIVRWQLYLYWVIYVVPDWWSKFFKIYQLVHISNIEFHIFEVFIDNSLRLAIFNNGRVFTFFNVYCEVWLFNTILVSVYIKVSNLGRVKTISFVNFVLLDWNVCYIC